MAGEFDFQNAQLPELKPLENSFEQNQTESELKALFIRLFKTYLGRDFFDINVAGAAHLGSFDLVRRKVNMDGLSLLQNESEEEATRYLYRAWMSRDNQGRGLHFLRTYLQLLYPNLCSVEQMWQEKDKEYPLALHTSIEDEDFVVDPKTMYLTSRVEIALDLSIETRSITTLTNIFRAILPARLMPQFRFWLIFNVRIKYKVFYNLFMEKSVETYLPWNVLVVTRDPKRMFYLGTDEEPEKAPKLVEGRISGDLRIEKV